MTLMLTPACSRCIAVVLLNHVWRDVTCCQVGTGFRGKLYSVIQSLYHIPS